MAKGETKKIFITRREAAAAASLSERTIFNLTKEGVLPCVRIGRSVRYRLADLEKIGTPRSQKL